VIKQCACWIFLLSLGLALVSCSPKVDQRLLGKWSGQDGDTFEFAADGRYIHTEKGHAGAEGGAFTVDNGTVLRLEPTGTKGGSAPLSFAVMFPKRTELELVSKTTAEKLLFKRVEK